MVIEWPPKGHLLESFKNISARTFTIMKSFLDRQQEKGSDTR